MFTFSSYEALIDLIEIKWKSLKQFKYQIFLKSKKCSTTQLFSDLNQLNKDSKLMIRQLSKVFSQYQDEEEVLTYINAMILSSDYFSSRVGDPDFPLEEMFNLDPSIILLFLIV